MGVISLADITDPSGNYIIPEAMKFKNAKRLNTNNTIEVVQQKPDPPAWSCWTRLIKQLTLENCSKLKKPLGEWTKSRKEIRVVYKDYRTEINTYKKTKEGYIKKHITHTESGTEKTGNTIHLVQQLPDIAIPCTISPTGTILSIHAKVKSPSIQKTTENRHNNHHECLIAVSDASVIEDQAT